GLTSVISPTAVVAVAAATSSPPLPTIGPVVVFPISPCGPRKSSSPLLPSLTICCHTQSRHHPLQEPLPFPPLLHHLAAALFFLCQPCCRGCRPAELLPVVPLPVKRQEA
ncbi:hypothetical protein BHE74_00052893, partial [Ensete ventricosum]